MWRISAGSAQDREMLSDSGVDRDGGDKGQAFVDRGEQDVRSWLRRA
jgi:hypothetical protein